MERYQDELRLKTLIDQFKTHKIITKNIGYNSM